MFAKVAEGFFTQTFDHVSVDSNIVETRHGTHR